MSDNIKDWGKRRQELENEEWDDDFANSPEESLDSTEDQENDDQEIDNQEQPSALTHPKYAELEEQLTAAEQKAHENWERYVREKAEADNRVRRAERDVQNAHKFALEKFVNSLIPVLDSMEQGLQLAEQHGDDAMREGIELTVKLFTDALEKHGVKQLNPVGEVFDPQFHEAMSIQASDTEPANTVLSVFQKGYTLNDRVIRPARVIVVKG